MTIEKQLLPAQYDLVFNDNPFPAIIGGLGSGKTEGGITRLLKLFLEDKGINVAYYMPTYDLIKLRAISGFEEALESYGVSYKTNQSDYKISVKGYGDIIFRSYERPNRIVAYEVAHSIVDELDTIKLKDAEIVWRKVNERNRQPSKLPNSISCVTTPDMGYNGFIYKKWFEEQKKGYTVIKASTYDNPFLPDDYIENIKANYDPILADLYLRGEIVSLNQNKVYHFYDRIKHYTNKTVNDFTDLRIGLDFNVGGTVATVHGLIGNKLYRVDEFVSHDTFDFINNLSRYNGKTISIYPDASGQNRKTNASETDIQMIQRAGYTVYVNNQNPAVRDRINAYNGLLAHDRYFINYDKCSKGANALENQGYDDKGEPEKWNTHPAIDDYNDASGYVVAYIFPISKPSTITKLHRY